jgi:hypothetical protein
VTEDIKTLNTLIYTLVLMALTIPAAVAQNQGYVPYKIIPQVVDGAGWKTTIYLINPSRTNMLGTPNLYFLDESGAMWNPPLRTLCTNMRSTPSSCPNPFDPAKGALLFNPDVYAIETAGTAKTLTQGWGYIAANWPGNIQVTYSFTQPDGTVYEAMEEPTPPFCYDYAFPFDSTNGRRTGVAWVNSSGQFTAGKEDYLSTKIYANGSVLVSDTVHLQSKSHTTAVMEERWPQMLNNTGMVMISVGVPTYNAFGDPTGVAQCPWNNHSVTVLRFSPTGAFYNVPLIF